MPQGIRFISLLLYCMLLSNLTSAQSSLLPFPQHIKYFKGVIKPDVVSQKQMDEMVRSFYTKWKELYIHIGANDCQYYIWVENSVNTSICVSEAQGYGMIITALMAGYDPDAQNLFNGLYNYCKAHPSKKNPLLMAWAQKNNFKDVDGTSATDGDLDIAYSLLLANAQWGSNGDINYLKEAKAMITAIREQELNPETYSILLSNAVEEESDDYYDTRTSDFMPAHFKSFEKFTKDKFWKKVVDKNYLLFQYMQKQFSPDAGLVPDFIQYLNRKPEPAGPNYLESKMDGSYNFNACRVPWRIATDFIINGDKRSKNFIDKINSWIKETTQNNPDNISAGYKLNGNDIRNRYYEAMCFIASFGVAAMVGLENQLWLNKLWDYIIGFDIDQFEYYDNTIKMICLIILSGNYWSP